MVLRRDELLLHVGCQDRCWKLHGRVIVLLIVRQIPDEHIAHRLV
jgi:hypothetical protein